MSGVDKKLRVLIMSVSALNKSNSAGSTFSNFFEGMEGVELASLYLGYGEPDNGLDMRYFQVNEKTLVKNLLNRSVPSGREVTPGESGAVSMSSGEAKGFDIVRTVRWQIFLWARELIWKVGRPHSAELKAFVKSFDPDVIMLSINDTCYLSRECRRISNEFGIPVCIFIGDDIYSLRRVSFSPLFWLDRLIKRASHRKIIKQSAKLFAMTDMAKAEFDRTFGVNCAVLTKSLDFAGELQLKKTDDNGVIRFVYTGNLYAGRWKSLAALGRALQKLNEEGLPGGRKAELKIYSMTPMTKSMSKALDVPAVRLMGGVPSSQIPGIQNDADVLVHAEAFGKKEMLIVRLSFSTKLVDYMHVPRCILAIGPREQASIDHLIRNDAALVAANGEEIYQRASEILSNPALSGEYAAKAWRCGREHHDRRTVQARLKAELQKAAEGRTNGI